MAGDSGGRVPPGDIPVSRDAVQLAHTVAGLASTFMLLSTAIFGTYLYSRIRPVVRLQIEDWVACAAYLLATVDASVGIAAVSISLGKNSEFVSAKQLSGLGKKALTSAFLGAWALAAIKISVACLFLRLKRSTGKPWRAFLFGMIAVQILTASFNTIMQATRYIPINGQWSPDLAVRAKSQVWSDHAFRIGICVTSSSNVATDMIFSILPVVILWDMKIPLREKLVVGSLMALGLVASAASIVKAVETQTFGKTGDITADGARIELWSLLEEQLALIAACVPRLKVQIQQFLIRHGLISESDPSSDSSRPHKYAVRKHGKRRSRVRDPYNAPFFGLSDHSIELTATGGAGVEAPVQKTSVNERVVSDP